MDGNRFECLEKETFAHWQAHHCRQRKDGWMYEPVSSSLWTVGCFKTSNHSITHELWVSEQKNERSGMHEQSEQGGASKWVSSASKRANRRASGLVLTSRFLAVLNHSALDQFKIIHLFSTSGVSERANNQSNEHSRAHKQLKQCAASKWASDTSKPARYASDPLLQSRFLCVLN